jgi:hypothetical protein
MNSGKPLPLCGRDATPARAQGPSAGAQGVDCEQGWLRAGRQMGLTVAAAILSVISLFCAT